MLMFQTTKLERRPLCVTPWHTSTLVNITLSPDSEFNQIYFLVSSHLLCDHRRFFGPSHDYLLLYLFHSFILMCNFVASKFVALWFFCYARKDHLQQPTCFGLSIPTFWYFISILLVHILMHNIILCVVYVCGFVYDMVADNDNRQPTTDNIHEDTFDIIHSGSVW